MKGIWKGEEGWGKRGKREGGKTGERGEMEMWVGRKAV
jgi:hypothetical protein